jgi:hypothetical protein
MEVTMKKTMIMAGLALALTASFAAAQPGINLSWNDCGVNGTASQTFNCASNTGTPFVLVASFIPPAGVPEFLGISSQIDITTSTPSLPLWWQHGTAFCRSTSGLAVNFDFTSGPFNCVDFYVGSAAGGFAYDVGFGTPNRARLRVQAAVPFDNKGPVDDTMEYYAYKVNLLRAKSTSTGSCVGCLEQACIVLNDMQLFQPFELGNDPTINNPANQNFVTWQAASVPGCPLSTPTQKSSWGQVKSLYR